MRFRSIDNAALWLHSAGAMLAHYARTDKAEFRDHALADLRRAADVIGFDLVEKPREPDHA